MKTDNRTRYTKKMICDCFLEILKDTPIQRITVKAICDTAQINRSTFYRYYKDPYDLLEQIENELWNSFQLQIAGLSQEDATHIQLKTQTANFLQGCISFVCMRRMPHHREHAAFEAAFE